MTINLTSIISTDLVSLRTEFRDLCGIPDMPDSSVNLWLNRGQKYLDQLTDFQYSPTRQAIVAQANSWLVPFLSECRVVQEVYLIDAVGGRNPISVLSHKQFYDRYRNIPASSGALPVACALATSRAVNALSATGGTPTYDEFVESTVDGASYRAMMFNTKLDKEYQFEIFGKFYSTPLADSAEPSFWLTNFSETLMAAALYKMQLIMYRNSEGAKDYLAEVMETTKQLNFDQAEEDAEHIDKMEG